MVVKVELGKNSYDILIERGALNRAGVELDLNRKVLVLTDSGVPKAYSERVASFCKEPYIYTVEQGEGSKSVGTWKKVLEFMLEKGFNRGDCVVAAGGGVVGDLAGFAAASYMRGIDFYNIPTTVLSQVDSSVGGKTAVNLGGVKNIVGAFYQPKKVIIDPEVLKTLPERQVSSGLAEAVKMALCFDEELFELFENGDVSANIDKIIEKSIKIKRDVVEKDEKEASLRRVLNFGHTLAHGIEAQGSLYHGECVALGMIPMCSPEVKERLIKVLRKCSLPVTVSVDKEQMLKDVSHDKKGGRGYINIVKVEKAGSFIIEKASLDEIEAIIQENF